MRSVMVVVMAALMMGGCATVVRGVQEQVAFDTAPSGAEVRVVIDNQFRPPEGEPAPPPVAMACVTPCVLQVKRHDKIAVTVTRPGYEREAFSLVPQPSGEGVGSTLGNALIGGVVGVALDAVTGATLDKCPNPVRITLRPLPAAAAHRGAARQESASFGYDPVAACKEQTTIKYRAHDMAIQGRSDSQ